MGQGAGLRAYECLGAEHPPPFPLSPILSHLSPSSHHDLPCSIPYSQKIPESYKLDGLSGLPPSPRHWHAPFRKRWSNMLYTALPSVCRNRAASRLRQYPDTPPTLATQPECRYGGWMVHRPSFSCLFLRQVPAGLALAWPCITATWVPPARLPCRCRPASVSSPRPEADKKGALFRRGRFQTSTTRTGSSLLITVSLVSVASIETSSPAK
ncbi:hypothetical protein LZ31DRAFT_270594 [Colletotrichum somersetense]|nr:hypothetical protein LZ31DRAFT_270594 [Colletotrichum somersetense]